MEMNRKHKPYLQPGDIDQLARQHVELMAEVWILRDRVRLLESVLQGAGLLKPDQLDTMVPDAELKAALQAERDAFVARIVGIDPEERTVDALRQRAVPPQNDQEHSN
ncbi:MAG: hypothetical protein JJU27_08835 [Gammaproteobacteria bacterium]|nr:hypothetical protein [Gammaproteobacteria bacterium]